MKKDPLIRQYIDGNIYQVEVQRQKGFKTLFGAINYLLKGAIEMIKEYEKAKPNR